MQARMKMMFDGIEVSIQCRDGSGFLARQQRLDEGVVFAPGLERGVLNEAAEILDADQLPRIDQVRLDHRTAAAGRHDGAMHLIVAMYDRGLVLTGRKLLVPSVQRSNVIQHFLSRVIARQSNCQAFERTLEHEMIKRILERGRRYDGTPVRQEFEQALRGEYVKSFAQR
jgi:hypothetical protein